MKKNYLNLVVDHTTIFVEPAFYKVTYALFRVVFGVAPEDILYEKRRDDKSMTFASRIGRYEASKDLNQAIIAIVEPTEKDEEPSHVRKILENRGGSIHCFHIALRTPDLIAFHKHAVERGVNFITPIMKDDDEDVIQVFSGEWYMPDRPASGFFFEFVQRNLTPALLKKLEEANRESWFRDKVFMGLYDEKETEYRSGKVKPFIDPELFREIDALLSGKKLWEISQADLDAVEKAMLAYANGRRATPASGRP